jgi:hypothetical protein
MRDVHSKGLLAAAERAEIWHIPVQADQRKQAFDKPFRLPERHADPSLGSARSGLKTVHWTISWAPFTLHRQAGLDGRVAVDGLSSPLAGGRSLPGHGGIEPDRQRPAALERALAEGISGAAGVHVLLMG